MAKARIYEIARDLGIESKDALGKAQELGLDVKTASSGLEASDAAVLKAALAADAPVVAEAPADTVTEPEAAPEPAIEAAPVEVEAESVEPEPAEAAPEPEPPEAAGGRREGRR